MIVIGLIAVSLAVTLLLIGIFLDRPQEDDDDDTKTS